MTNRESDNSVFGHKLLATAMIFPFRVQFHAKHRLLVWRPRGLLDETAVSEVIAALGQVEWELHEPFNRFLDAAGVEQVDLNYDYVISVAFIGASLTRIDRQSNRRFWRLIPNLFITRRCTRC